METNESNLSTPDRQNTNKKHRTAPSLGVELQPRIRHTCDGVGHSARSHVKAPLPQEHQQTLVRRRVQQSERRGEAGVGPTSGELNTCNSGERGGITGVFESACTRMYACIDTEV